MRARRVAFAFALLVPALAAFWVSALFTLNHFHEWPYIWDSAWYSAIIHHQGFIPKNPPIASSAPSEITSYWGIHVSLLVSFTSLLSYLYPGDRVDWYCLFQGAIYAPLGVVTAMLVGRENIARTWGMAFLALLVSLVFALNGEVLACIGYPHFEIFIPVGVCFMLVGLATGRRRLAYVGLALAAATREDGGFHAALFLGAVFASDLLGAPFPITRKELIRMGVISFAASCVCFVVQKKLFVSASLFKHEYLGEPPYAHVTWPTMVMRTKRLFEQAGFVVFPFFATAILAAVRRDARYLLGYLAGLPWFLLNFFAAQDLKSAFSIYTGFPFVNSIFWVAVYAMVAPRKPSTARTLTGLGVVSLVATLGLQLSYSFVLPLFARYSHLPPSSHSALLEVSRPLRANPNAWGRIWVDVPMATWTLEGMPADRLVAFDRPPRNFNERDAFIFFMRTNPPHDPLGVLAGSPYQHCGHYPDTPVFLCLAGDRALPPKFVTESPWLYAEAKTGNAHAVGPHVSVASTRQPTCDVWGPFVKLPVGPRRAIWNVVVHDCLPDAAPARVDVSVDYKAIASADVTASGEVAVTLDVPALVPHELRTWSGACAFDIVDLRVE